MASLRDDSRHSNGIPNGSSAVAARATTALTVRRFLLTCTLVAALVALIVGCGYIPHRVTTASTPAIAMANGIRYTGSCNAGLCSWLGIQYAAPPVGAMRFAPPRKIPTPGDSVSANQMGPRCPQDGDVAQQDEDCLYLNIQRPKLGFSSSEKLPVMVFYHGGGFQSGSANDNDPSKLLKVGMANNQKVLIVRIAYRLGLFGFLASDELRLLRDGNNRSVGLNHGFQDMTMATQWVKDNIDGFGGDPNRITIWGQSAGSFGASAQMLAFANKTPPFQAAILESGAPGGVPIDPPSVKNGQYDRVLSMSNCTTSRDHLSCLRSVPWQTIRKISIVEGNRAMQTATYARGYYAWTPVLDGGPTQGGFFADRPSVVINRKSFARVPVLHGDCLDEGTFFTPHSFNDVQSMTDWLSHIYFGNATDPSLNSSTVMQEVLQAYPDDPTQGSPFNPEQVAATDRFFGSTNQYKRAAAIYGDVRYQSNRRFWLQALSDSGIKAYSYLYSQKSKANSPSVGVPHGSDLSALLQTSANPISQTYARQYLAFAASQDPSGAAGLPAWPPYTSSAPTLLQYKDGTVTQIRDDFRQDAITLLNSPTVLLLTGR